MDSLVREFSGKFSVEKFSAEMFIKLLTDRLNDSYRALGLEIIFINVQSVEPVDEKISEVIRQSEAARIFGQTDRAN